MNKEKIAISIDKNILEQLDSTIDGNNIRSRSQAIETILKKQLCQGVDTAIILLHKKQLDLAFRKVEGKTLIEKQVEFFNSYGIKRIVLLTGNSDKANKIIEIVPIEVYQKDCLGNAQIIYEFKDNLPNDFVVMSGDIYYKFNLARMIKEHLDSKNIATMGLMTRKEPSKYGSAILEGNLVVDFEEKNKNAKSHVVNAGIYIFNKKVFDSMNEKIISLEKDFFPEASKKKRLAGFFSFGDYFHMKI